MRKFSLLLMIISLTTACGSIKDKQLLKVSASEAEAIEINTDLSIAATTNELITDSSRQDYLVEISPLGVFTYDAVNGYKGMASQLLWKGKLQQQRQMKRKEDQLIGVNYRQTQATKIKKTQLEEHLKKSDWGSAIWLWLAVAGGIFLAWVILVSRLRKKLAMI
jgi:hypothetical protein